MMGGGLLVVVPHVLRMHRGLSKMPCPTCGKKVGGCTTIKGRVHLQCSQCGRGDSNGHRWQYHWRSAVQDLKPPNQ